MSNDKLREAVKIMVENAGGDPDCGIVCVDLADWQCVLDALNEEE